MKYYLVTTKQIRRKWKRKTYIGLSVKSYSPQFWNTYSICTKQSQSLLCSKNSFYDAKVPITTCLFRYSFPSSNFVIFHNQRYVKLSRLLDSNLLLVDYLLLLLKLSFASYLQFATLFCFNFPFNITNENQTISSIVH